MSLSRSNTCLLLLLLIALTLCLKLLLGFLADPQHFPLSTIKVIASYQNLDRHSIEKIITPYAKSSFFSLNSKQMIAEIKRLDWVEHVRVQRIWPDSVKISITESTPYALWNDRLLITEQGEAITKVNTHQTYFLPKLYGLESERRKILQTYKQLRLIDQNDILTLSQLIKTKHNSWQAITQEGIDIQLGSFEPTANFQRLIRLYPSLTKQKLDQIAAIDLRYPHGVALRRAQVMRKQ